MPAWWAYLALFAIVFARVQAVYWLGRATGRGVRSRQWGRRLEGPRIRRAEELLNRYGAPAVTVSLITPGVQTAVNALAGITRMPFVRYLVAMLIGCAAWALVYTTGLAALWAWTKHAISEPWFGVLSLAVVAAAILVVRRTVTRHRRRATEPPHATPAASSDRKLSGQ